MIRNLTNNTIVSQKEIICKTTLSQGLGLMFRRQQNLVMIFDKEKKISLHNLFVFFSIDVLIVDKDMKIVEIKRNFKPFTLFKSKEKGMYVVELGIKGEYKKGDRIGLK
jgi:uncharacterized membrane protein (UPF0127 family)